MSTVKQQIYALSSDSKQKHFASLMGNKSLRRIDTQYTGAKFNKSKRTDKSHVQLLLFGCNVGKSHWFHGSFSHESVDGVTFKKESFKLGDFKLPVIETIIYDTSENIRYLNDTLKYLPSINGLILTYNIHDIESLNHLNHCIDKIKETIHKYSPILLLGMKEDDEIILDDCIDNAQQFASKQNLFHLQLDIKYDINNKQPYIYLLKQILHHRQLSYETKNFNAMYVDVDRGKHRQNNDTITSIIIHQDAKNDSEPLSDDPELEMTTISDMDMMDSETGSCI